MIVPLSLSCKINRSQAGLPLLEAMALRFSYRSRVFWQERIAVGDVHVNGMVAASQDVVGEGDLLEFLLADHEEPDLDTRYQVVWEDADLILVNKPADLPVHSTRRIFYQTMTEVLRRDRGSDLISPIHRLDRETSGLMFFAKTTQALKEYQRRFHDFMRGKFYLALVRGAFRHDELLFSMPLGETGIEPLACKMQADLCGKPCETRFFRLGETGEISLLLVRITTGRKHQIRAHLEILGFPIVGDKLYSYDGEFFVKRCRDELQEADLTVLGAKHHLLHAFAVRTKPAEGSERWFFAEELPAEFSRYLLQFPDWRGRAESVLTRVGNGL